MMKMGLTEGDDTQEEGEDDKDPADTDMNVKEKATINVNELRRKNQLTESVCTDGFNMGNSSQDEDTNSGSNQVQQPLPSVVIHHGNVRTDSNTALQPANLMGTTAMNPQVFQPAPLTLASASNHIPNPPPYPAAIYLGGGGGLGKGNTLGDGVSPLSSHHLPLSVVPSLPLPVPAQPTGLLPLQISTHASTTAVLTQSVPQVTSSSVGVQHWAGNRAGLGVSYPTAVFPAPSTQPSVTQDIQEDIDIDMFVNVLAQTQSKP